MDGVHVHVPVHVHLHIIIIHSYIMSIIIMLLVHHWPRLVLHIFL